MACNRKFPPVWVVCGFCLLVVTVPAYGYVDPNAAGLISQILTPLLIAGAAGVTFLRKRIVDAFSGLLQRFRRRTDA
jgi:hypothetical protein